MSHRATQQIFNAILLYSERHGLQESQLAHRRSAQEQVAIILRLFDIDSGDGVQLRQRATALPALLADVAVAS